MTKIINLLFRQVWFPLVFQIATLVVFALLIMVGFSANTDDMAFAKILRNTNIANLLVWSYWWPLVILSAIFLGRTWCTICPMELITSLAARVGIKRTPPGFVRSGWVIVIFYILILFVGIHMLAIHRVPFRMAIYMLMLLVTAVVTGLFFSRNTFCAHICPVGYLIGLYARLAPLSFGVRDKSICSTCKDQSCVSKVNAYTFQGRSCGVGLKPSTIEDNTECLLCGQCVKACAQNGQGIEGRPNPGWFFRGWFKDLTTLKPLTFPHAIFCLVVSGFIVYEVFTEWGVTKELLLWLPTQIKQLIGAESILTVGLTKTLTLFVALPAVLWFVPLGVFHLLGGRLSPGDYLLKFGISFIPVMAAAHATKAMLKMTSRIPYWEHTLKDPVGVETARSIMDKSIELAPLPFWRELFITLFALTLMGGAVVLSIHITQKLIAKHLSDIGLKMIPLYMIPIVYGGGFLTMLALWRWN